MMKHLWIIVIGLLLLSNSDLQAQKKPSAYVDKQGILRWNANQSEVNEFGVHYALPFSSAYSSFKKLHLSHQKGVDEDIYHITRLGLKSYRIHLWDSEVSDSLGNLVDNHHLQLLDYTLKQMKNRGFKIVLTPLTFYETTEKEYGFGNIYRKRDSFKPEAVKVTENYLFQFMNHVNRYTGVAYKDDPDIIAFEIYNEPEHPSHTAEQATNYVNTLVKAIRRSGCKKPLFYCMSIAPQLRKGFLDANVQGGSAQWYPVSHNSGFDFKGNLLTHVDRWPKDSLTDDIKSRKKALMAYEIDAADNNYSYTYPMMARSMRTAGFQFAAMFSYDPLGIAYSNYEYRTHFMNMAYTPQKALGLKIAGEIFRRIPRETKFEPYPADTVFDVFRLSHSQNLAEMVSDEKFLYTNNTQSTPPDLAKLKEITGYGSSTVVQYNGRGLYFLDKLEKGIWRLEVMPDATCVDIPFSNPQMDKEVTAIVWDTYPMTINLPDLGDAYSMTGINEGNSIKQTAKNKQVSVSPGTYLLQTKGISSKWKPGDKWKDITLKEFVAPKPTEHFYMLHQPTGEITKGKPHTINIEVISQQKPEELYLLITTMAPRKLPPIVFRQTSRYGYAATIPNEILEKENILNYQIAVTMKGETRTYPEDKQGYFVNFANTRMYTLKVVEKQNTVCLLDVENDRSQMRRSHRHYRYIFHPSALPGKLGLELSTDNLIYTSLYLKDKIAGRINNLANKTHLKLRASALSDQPVKAWIAIQLENGLEYGATITLTKDQSLYEIPLSKLQQIRITGPGEKGFVFIDPFEGTGKKEFNIQNAETIKMAVLPNDNKGNTARMVVEYVILD
jgi:hypothetical protein